MLLWRYLKAGVCWDQVTMFMSHVSHLRILRLCIHVSLCSGSDAADNEKIEDLSVQAAQDILSASNPLARLADLALRFPASQLSAVPVNSTVRNAFQEAWRSMQPGGGFALINGILVRCRPAGLALAAVSQRTQHQRSGRCLRMCPISTELAPADALEGPGGADQAARRFAA
jgi:Thioredoxin-like domain